MNGGGMLIRNFLTGTATKGTNAAFLRRCLGSSYYGPVAASSAAAAASSSRAGIGHHRRSKSPQGRDDVRWMTSSSATDLIINATGYDRVGIVSDVTGVVIDAGGNVGDSHASKLGDHHFSLMMLVTVPSSEAKNDVKKRLADVKDLQTAVFDVEGDESEKIKHAAVGYSGYFTLEGADNPGIVHTVTSALAKRGLSVNKLETDQEIAPHGGTVLFRMRGVVAAYEPLSSGFDIASIRSDLVELGDSLNCEIHIEETADDSYQASFYAG